MLDMHCTQCCLSKMVLHVNTKGVLCAVSIQVVTNSLKFYLVLTYTKLQRNNLCKEK